MRHAAWLLALSVATSRAAFAAEPVERLTAFAVDMSNLAAGQRTGVVDIVVDRWSTDKERDRL